MHGISFHSYTVCWSSASERQGGIILLTIGSMKVGVEDALKHVVQSCIGVCGHFDTTLATEQYVAGTKASTGVDVSAFCFLPVTASLNV